MESELHRGILEFIVRKTLSWDPMHGYGTGRWIGQLSSCPLQIEESSVYPAPYAQAVGPVLAAQEQPAT